MCSYRHQLSLFLFIFHLAGKIKGQNIPSDWRSSTTLSSPGNLFTPLDYSALFLSESHLPSLLRCTRHCHSTRRCRVFDYDPQSTRCRLFEGELTSMGQLTPSPSSPLARVGSLRITSHQFINLGQPCSMCLASRYMRCSLNACQCPASTFYDGSICRSQRLLGQPCQNASECRTDLNYACLPRRQCGPVSLQSGITVGGYGNGTSGSALNALRNPTGVALDSAGSLYVTEFGNHRVIKLNEGSLMGSLVAGTGISGNGFSQLSSPSAIYIDAALNMYVSDSYNSRVMLWRQNSSAGTMVAGTGTAGSAQNMFSNTGDLLMDSSGNLYISDYYNGRVMKWTMNATSGTIVAGTGVSGSGNQQLNRPYGLFLSEASGYLYIADSFNHRIQRYSLNFTMNATTVAGGNGAGTGAHQLNTPYDVYVSERTRSIYIADYGNQRVQRWNFDEASGVTVVGTTGISGSSSTLLSGPSGIVLNTNETYMYVSEMMNHRIQRFQLI